MSKQKTVYFCTECGGDSAKWQGQCPHCNAWNTLQEFKESKAGKPRTHWAGKVTEITNLEDVGEREVPRLPTGIGELDRVLGGGFVPGSILLLGGDPGIGKSTLLLQTASVVPYKPVAYASGEESAEQIKMRANRLHLKKEGIKLISEVSCEAILASLDKVKPVLAVIDSIQTIYSEALDSAPGSVSQVRECASKLTAYAKSTGTVIVLVGHVTKDGSVAGPRVLEHMVDTVLYFEGEAKAGYRLLRATKNRFGASGELGVFAMTATGLEGVDNPSALFLAEHEKPVPGVAVVATVEGERPLLVEVQALIEETRFPTARKLAVGMDPNRIAMLIAVLGERCGTSFADYNVYMNAVGGAKVTEPAGDLAIVAACYSSLHKKIIPSDTVVFGEIGLAGELRAVNNPEQRLKEIKRLGFTTVVMPRYKQKLQTEGLNLVQVPTVEKALNALFSN